MKVLIVEDDPKVARFISRVLVEEGYEVDHCGLGGDAIVAAQTIAYDMVVLDWMLPDVDGIAVCREIRRSRSLTPILMLTARGETAERVLGLETGADDYMVKPFEVEEFVARIRALIRRTAGYGQLHCGDLQVDQIGHRALLLGTPLTLTSREYALLLYLVQQCDQIVSRTSLLAQVWQTNFDPGSNLVEVHMSRLRDKLGDHAWMLETVRRSGYRLRSKVTP
ncbi:MAG: response regulator transcription factor [Polyangiales bacterium]